MRCCMPPSWPAPNRWSPPSKAAGTPSCPPSSRAAPTCPEGSGNGSAWLGRCGGRAVVWILSNAVLSLIGLAIALLSRTLVNAVVGHHTDLAVGLGVALAAVFGGVQVALCVMLTFYPKVEELGSALFDQV